MLCSIKNKWYETGIIIKRSSAILAKFSEYEEQQTYLLKLKQK